MSRTALAALLTLAALVATSAGMAAGDLESDRQYCVKSILTLPQAAVAMDEPETLLLAWNDGNLLLFTCTYFGHFGNDSHHLEVSFGTYAEARKYLPAPWVCEQSSSACRDLKKVRTATNYHASFALLMKALDKVGVVKRLWLGPLEGNPAFVWRPAESDQATVHLAAWAFVYMAKSKNLIMTECVEGTPDRPGHPDLTPDAGCAIRAAVRAYRNLSD